MTYQGAHVKDKDRITTRRIARHYWHATLHITPSHVVLGAGRTEAEALRQLAVMLWKGAGR